MMSSMLKGKPSSSTRQLGIKWRGLHITWRAPQNHIPDWPADKVALPPVYDQEKKDICSPVAVAKAMTSKMMIDHVLHGGPPPVHFSIPQLIDALESFPKRRRFVSVLLKWVIEYGVVAEENYIDGKVVPADAPRYHFLTWEYFNPKEPGYKQKILDFLQKCTIIGELNMKEHYDPSGLERYYEVGAGAAASTKADDSQLIYRYSTRKGDKRRVGHAVVFSGAGKDKDDYLEYMNSYGTGFGKNGGFGETEIYNIHYGYGISSNIVVMVDPPPYPERQRATPRIRAAPQRRPTTPAPAPAQHPYATRSRRTQ